MRRWKWFRKTGIDVTDDFSNAKGQFRKNKMASAGAAIWHKDTMIARVQQVLWSRAFSSPRSQFFTVSSKTHRIASFSTTRRNTKTKISQSRHLRCAKKGFPDHIKFKLFSECYKYKSRLHPSLPAFTLNHI